MIECEVVGIEVHRRYKIGIRDNLQRPHVSFLPAQPSHALMCDPRPTPAAGNRAAAAAATVLMISDMELAGIGIKKTLQNKLHAMGHSAAIFVRRQSA